MSKAHKLTPLGVKNLKPEAKNKWYIDGGGLYLYVKSTGAKSWAFRYMLHGVDNWLGLGPYPEVTLAEARELAATNRKSIRAGINVAGEKQTTAATVRADRANAKTFDWCAAKYIEAHAPKWSNVKSKQQWENTLATYASPTIGTLDVAKIETAHILKILEPIWHAKAETASRVRGRLESILDWAAAHKHRSGENPARLKGHIDVLLPARNKVATVEHFPALPYEQASEFTTALRERKGIAARGVEFGILTAARSGEVRGATWDELNEEAGLWIVAASRMKAQKEHRVPLSAEALQVIADMKKIKSGDLIFPGQKVVAGKPVALSDSTLSAVLKRMDADRIKAEQKGWRDRNDEVITMHGFRSTFMDWAADVSPYPAEMADLALAHTVADKVRAAYQRGDAMEKRRAMMQSWADYCSTVKANAKQTEEAPPEEATIDNG